MALEHRLSEVSLIGFGAAVKQNEPRRPLPLKAANPLGAIEKYLLMTQTDDIDLLLTLNPHGWSTCFLIVDGKSVELTITHIFSATTDPYIELIQALTNLINGHNSVTFFWHGEPGGEKIEISRIATQQNKVLVKVDGFGGDFTEEPKEYEPTIHFEVKLKQLIILFYLQLKKTAMLLQDPQFAHNRANDFPMQDYLKFEILANQYLVS